MPFRPPAEPTRMSRAVRRAVKRAQVMVRLNPPNPATAQEVEMALAAGAELLMLPFFHTSREVDEFCRCVRGRVPVVPLVETAAAARALREYVGWEGIGEIYIGLNDLHVDLGQRFIFQPIVTGLVEELAGICKQAQKPFGFGGIARIGEGEVRAECILAEHVRLGSSAVILSRAFHYRATSVADLKSKVDLSAELKKMRKVEERHRKRSAAQVKADQEQLHQQVATIVARLSSQTAC
jgi:2-keto-3-deoxy-L-rhamnonate aldolase RhmA